MKTWRVPYPKFGDGPGLQRVTAIAAQLGIDLASFGANAAVITGSNGKGSTAAMLGSILRETGKSVGRFTSPHLFRLNERFTVDGEDISDEALALHWQRVAAAAESAGEAARLGGFEFLFLIAASWFADRLCDYTVWEAGIGGRLDPVRLVEARRTALVSLDLEHTELLGETLEEIAFDKLDAAPRGAAVFVGASCAPLRAQIEAHCAQRRVTPYFTTPFEAQTPLPGPHQRENTSLAIAMATSMSDVNDDDVARGLEQTRWPGRLETINDDPLAVIDVGHTPAGIRAALEGFSAIRGGRNSILICGASADKDAHAIIGALAPAFSIIICAQACHKGRAAPEIAAIATTANPNAEIVIADSIADARTTALAKARGGNTAVYVAGGLFLAAEFKAAHLGIDPASLAFF